MSDHNLVTDEALARRIVDLQKQVAALQDEIAMIRDAWASDVADFTSALSEMAAAAGLPTGSPAMTTMDERQIIIDALSAGRCPDCNFAGGFIFGPRGGLAVNIECGNSDCRARFNVTAHSGEIVFAQRIEKESEGGGDWWVLGLPHIKRTPGSLIDFIHSPPNEGGALRELYAFVSQDEGGEGLCAYLLKDLGATVLVSGKAANAERMKPIAQELARTSSKQVRLVRFHAGEILWESDNDGSGGGSHH